ncbi:hypothetical protein ADUPG1_010665 [Aduncisulcus paluster]|uniref:Cilia- and flagella-associated protein 157 n=1 Tax=Aduncisulcus paluster TaxID=2918883 RepID=A0ABQ5JSR3_9EUKA|nr:hypothetical protein ADUPG1_010665 [Aduncisulcus paluster]
MSGLDKTFRSAVLGEHKTSQGSRALMESLSALQQKIHKLENEKLFYKESMTLAETENTKLRDRITSLQDQSSRTQKEREKYLQEELFKEREKTRKLLAAHDHVKADLEDLKIKNEDLLRQNTDMRHQVSEYRVRLTEIESSQREAVEKVKRESFTLEGDKHALQRTIDEMKVRMDAQDAAVKEADQRKSDAEKAAQTLAEMQVELLEKPLIHDGFKLKSKKKKRGSKKKLPKSKYSASLRSSVRPQRSLAVSMPVPSYRPRSSLKPKQPPATRARSRPRSRTRRQPPRTPRTSFDDLGVEAQKLLKSLLSEKDDLVCQYTNAVSLAKSDPVAYAKDIALQQEVAGLLEEISRKDEQISRMQTYKHGVEHSPMGRLLSSPKRARKP